MPSADVFVFHHCCSGQWQREKTNGNTDILHTDFQLNSQSNNSTMRESYRQTLVISSYQMFTRNLGSNKPTSKPDSLILLAEKKIQTPKCTHEQHKPVRVGVSSQRTHRAQQHNWLCWDEREQKGGVGYINHHCDLTRVHTYSRHGVCSTPWRLLYHFSGVCQLLHCAVVLYSKCEYLSL